MNTIKSFVLLGIISLFISSCKPDEELPTTANLQIDISGLEDLGEDYAYEGWLIVDGSAVSAGVFNVDAAGNLTKNSFELDASDVDNATAYVLTIEPSPDNDPGPSAVHLVGGEFNGKSASVTTSHGSAIGTDFTTSTGNYILATPTDGGSNTDELSGVWWLNPSDGPGPGLDLPSLPNGWVYEGWAVIDGVPVSTGTFTDQGRTDDNALFSGTAGGPPFPGEDFLNNAPTGLNFPTDLSGATVVISVEPSPDNSAAPFILKPLVGSVPSNAVDHTLYGMDNNAIATNPTGTVSR